MRLSRCTVACTAVSTVRVSRAAKDEVAPRVRAVTTHPRSAAPPSPSRWLVRAVIAGPIIGVLAALITGYVFADTVSAADASLDGPGAFYVAFVRFGILAGLAEGLIVGLIMRRVVGSESRPNKTLMVALGVPALINVLMFFTGPNLWTFLALVLLPPVLTMVCLRILFSIDRRTGRSGI